MRTIYKYFLNHTGISTIPLPVGSQILRVDVQFNTATVWAEVNTKEDIVDKKWLAVQTGDIVPENGLYRGTCILNDGHYILHYYEIS